MKKAYIFLADGFEEVEGITVIDLLRRAEVEVSMVSMTEKLVVHGAHGIDICANTLFEEQEFISNGMLILPGGMPGTTYLGAHEKLKILLDKWNNNQRWIAAICAAPTIFGDYGYLQNKKATCFPGMEHRLKGALISEEPVVRDGHIITSRGMGTAIPFALTLIEILKGKEEAEKLRKAIVFQS
ncbi:MAG: DJ-1/PfpI family protein [Lachnospiraceae bacterium]